MKRNKKRLRIYKQNNRFAKKFISGDWNTKLFSSFELFYPTFLDVPRPDIRAILPPGDYMIGDNGKIIKIL